MEDDSLGEIVSVIRAVLPQRRAKGRRDDHQYQLLMGVTTAVPTESLYNMSKFALEGLTEGLYYELKPLNISLHLVEQGGSRGNNFRENIVFNTNNEITDYEPLTAESERHVRVSRPAAPR